MHVFAPLRFPVLLLAIVALATPLSVRASADLTTEDYDFVVEVLRRDYAGFPTKTKDGRGTEFARLVREHRAAIERDPDSAPKEIRALLDWFQDRHLALSASPSAEQLEAADLSALAAKGPRLAITEADARAAYAEAPDTVAGIWRSVGGNYRLAVVPSPAQQDELVGVVLSTRSPSWGSGQIKFKLLPHGKALWRMGDHSEKPTSAHPLSNLIRLPEVGVTLIRDYPGPTLDRDRLLPSERFFLRRLSPKTLWLRLPDFASEHRAEIEALLEANDAALRSTPNLIIDLRDNSGGSDSSYDKVMSYLYTRPIYSIGAEIRNTARNIAYFEAVSRNDDLPRETRDFVSDLVTRLREYDQEWVPMFTRGFSIETYPEVMPFPKRVGIIGTGAGSSGEQFIINARFSRKVTLFGGPTAGVIDYSNVAEAPLPSDGDHVLRWPTTRSQRLPEEPLDNVGVPPDVPLGARIEDPVGAVQAWLERQPDGD